MVEIYLKNIFMIYIDFYFLKCFLLKIMFVLYNVTTINLHIFNKRIFNIFVCRSNEIRLTKKYVLKII